MAHARGGNCRHLVMRGLGGRQRKRDEEPNCQAGE
jgi:hypothetical protein